MTKNYPLSDNVLSETMDLHNTIGFQASLLTSQLRKNVLDILSRAQVNLNPDEIGILSLLMKNKSMTMTELAEGLQKDNANMTRMIKGLELRCLISKKRDEIDKRVSRVVLTEAGLDEVHSAWQLMDELVSQAIMGISQEEHDLTCDVLKKINANLNLPSVSKNGNS